MLLIEKEVQNLIARKALHLKKGVRMGSETWRNLLDHFQEELDEFDDAVNNPVTTKRQKDEETLEELGDMLGLLIHATLKCGFTFYQIEQREIAKLYERFK